MPPPKHKRCACGSPGKDFTRGGWVCARCLKFEEAYYERGHSMVAVSKPKKVIDPQEKLPRPGEITLAEWKVLEARRSGFSIETVASKLCRGGYPELKLRRVNKFFAFVTV